MACFFIRHLYFAIFKYLSSEKNLQRLGIHNPNVDTSRAFKTQFVRSNNGAGLPPRKWGMAELDIDVCKNSQTVARESNRKPHIDRCFQSKVENIGAGMSTLELGTG